MRSPPPISPIALEDTRDATCGSSSMLLTRPIVVTRLGVSTNDDLRLSSGGSSVPARRVLRREVLRPGSSDSSVTPRRDLATMRDDLRPVSSPMLLGA